MEESWADSPGALNHLALLTMAWPFLLNPAHFAANLILAKECVGFGKCLPINKESVLQKNVLITNYTGKGAEQASDELEGERR